MTKKMLEAYQPNKRLIDRNYKKIEDERFREIPGVLGKVKGSSKDFPYIEQHFSVEMDEPTEADKQSKRIRRWRDEIDRAEEETEAVEQFVSGIPDARDRELFTYRYIDGMRVTEVAKVVGYTHGRVSQIIKKYLKD